MYTCDKQSKIFITIRKGCDILLILFLVNNEWKLNQIFFLSFVPFCVCFRHNSYFIIINVKGFMFRNPLRTKYSSNFLNQIKGNHYYYFNIYNISSQAVTFIFVQLPCLDIKQQFINYIEFQENCTKPSYILAANLFQLRVCCFMYHNYTST